MLADALDDELTYKTRADIVQDIAVAQPLHRQLSVASIPAGYPQTRCINFDQASILVLFHYANRRAAAGTLWVTPSQSVLRNFDVRPEKDAATATRPVVAMQSMP